MNVSRRVAMKRKQSIIKSLPHDLLKRILALVAADSLIDLHNTELSCKDFLQLANDDYVFQHASMDKFPIALWPIGNEAAELFLKKCEESGNSEALFRQGMLEYFSLGNDNLGLELLNKAVRKGHLEATYVFGIVLICSENRFFLRGNELLCSLKKKSSSRKFGMIKCRMKTERVIWSLWIRKIIVPEEDYFGEKSCDCRDEKRWRSRGWEEDEDQGDECDSCWMNREVIWFCKLLRNSSGHVN